MKAKQYAAQILVAGDLETFERLSVKAMHEMILEFKAMSKTRNIQKPAAIAALAKEFDNKWRIVCSMCNTKKKFPIELNPDGFGNSFSRISGVSFEDILK